MALPDRKAQAPDRKALAKAIEDLLLASGAELDSETRETPARVASRKPSSLSLSSIVTVLS